MLLYDQVTVEAEEVCGGILAVWQAAATDGGPPRGRLQAPDPCLPGMRQNILLCHGLFWGEGDGVGHWGRGIERGGGRGEWWNVAKYPSMLWPFFNIFFWWWWGSGRGGGLEGKEGVWDKGDWWIGHYLECDSMSSILKKIKRFYHFGGGDVIKSIEGLESARTWFFKIKIWFL